MQRILVPGVAIGGIVEVMDTDPLAMPPIFYLLFTNVNMPGGPQEEVGNALTQAFDRNWKLLTLPLLLGSVCATPGGHIATSIPRPDEIIGVCVQLM